jgi:hypothetical protein
LFRELILQETLQEYFLAQHKDATNARCQNSIAYSFAAQYRKITQK